MQLKKTSLILLFFAVAYLPLSAQGNGQSILFEEHFDNGAIHWTLDGIIDANGISWPGWRIYFDGAADGAPHWGGRESFQTNPPMIGIDADTLFTVTSPIVGGEPVLTFSAVATLDSTLDFSAENGVLLSFTQYFREISSSTTVEVSSDNGVSWEPFEVNLHVNTNVETSNRNEVVLDISTVAGGSSQVKIRFVIEGAWYFWFLDDVIIRRKPVNYKKTIPEALGDSLASWSYPFAVDDTLGGAFNPDELIIKWIDGTPEGRKDTIREQFLIDSVELCLCDTLDLELWVFPEDIVSDGVNLFPNGQFSDSIQFNTGLIEGCNCLPGSFCIVNSANEKCTDFQDVIPPNNSGQFLAINGSISEQNLIWESELLTVAEGVFYVLALDIFPDLGLDIPNDPTLQWRVMEGNTVRRVLFVEESERGEWTTKYNFWENTSQGESTVTIQLWQSSSNAATAYGIDNLTITPLTAESLIILDPEEKKGEGMAQSEVEEAEHNYYNFTELLDNPEEPNMLSIPIDLPDTTLGNSVVVAVEDTGISLSHEAFAGHIWANSAEIIDGKDNDGNCLIDDVIGWNFVDDNKNPSDRFHGHGTHIGDLVLNTARCLSFKCNIKLLPLRIGDNHGLITDFRAVCATHYAIDKGANIINQSYGRYGVFSNIFEDVLNLANAKGIICVASAGNEELDLDSFPHYPGNYLAQDGMPNVASVFDNGGEWVLSEFSNSSENEATFSAPGEGLWSADIGEGSTQKSGTSMATATTTGAIAELICNLPGLSSGEVIAQLYESNTPDIGPLGISMGRVLGVHYPCIVPTGEPIGQNGNLQLSLFPNPTNGQMNLKFEEDIQGEVYIRFFDALGREQAVFKYESFLAEETYQLDISWLQAGIYTVLVQSEIGYQTVQLVVMNE